MTCPKCDFQQPDGSLECVQCGIIIEKYLARHNQPSEQISHSSPYKSVESNDEEPKGFIGFTQELLFYVKPEINPFYFGGRVILYLIIFIVGWKFILTPMEGLFASKNFLHMINLPFHEAGHMIFRPFGTFIMMLGGSLMQLLIPLLCLITLLIKTRDTYGASICLWWLGESFMDLAPYINDARALKMILLGGVTGRDVADYHDWEYILRKLGWLQYDHTLATLSFVLGILLMLCTFIWGGYLLFRQFKNLDRG